MALTSAALATLLVIVAAGCADKSTVTAATDQGDLDATVDVAFTPTDPPLVEPDVTAAPDLSDALAEDSPPPDAGVRDVEDVPEAVDRGYEPGFDVAGDLLADATPDAPADSSAEPEELECTDDGGSSIVEATPGTYSGVSCLCHWYGIEAEGGDSIRATIVFESDGCDEGSVLFDTDRSTWLARAPADLVQVVYVPAVSGAGLYLLKVCCSGQTVAVPDPYELTLEIE